MKKYIIIGVALIALSSCQKLLIGSAKPNNPTNNFEELWNGYNDYYGLFEVTHLNWDSVHSV